MEHPWKCCINTKFFIIQSRCTARPWIRNRAFANFPFFVVDKEQKNLKRYYYYYYSKINKINKSLLFKNIGNRTETLKSFRSASLIFFIFDFSSHLVSIHVRSLEKQRCTKVSLFKQVLDVPSDKLNPSRTRYEVATIRRIPFKIPRARANESMESDNRNRDIKLRNACNVEKFVEVVSKRIKASKRTEKKHFGDVFDRFLPQQNASVSRSTITALRNIYIHCEWNHE